MDTTLTSTADCEVSVTIPKEQYLCFLLIAHQHGFSEQDVLSEALSVGLYQNWGDTAYDPVFSNVEYTNKLIELLKEQLESTD